LRQDPTTVTAVSTLGINFGLNGDTPHVRQLFAYAEKLSRRDLRTQLWAIEYAVKEGDIVGALKHYDIALRTNPKISEILFPVLAEATTDLQVRAELIKLLLSKPEWSEAFINYAAARQTNPRAIASLFVDLRRAGIAVPNGAHARIVNALIAGGQADDAWTYYALIRANVDRRRSRDPQFNAGIEEASVFDWVAINDPGFTTSIQRGSKQGAFEFSASPSIGGPMLRQMQMLPQGTYRLTVHSSGTYETPNAQPYWTLNCIDGRELGRINLPNSTQENGRVSGIFSVPSGCAVQALTLAARPSETVSGLSGQIDYALLAPAN
jgi:hypothetical protein